MDRPHRDAVNPDDLHPRLRAVCDLMQATMREEAGRHEYDGKAQDLSPAGVRAGLSRLAATGADPLADAHDDAHLTAFETGLRADFGELELHRSNPLFHLGELDLACYDKEYAPAEQRAEMRVAHVRQWPAAIDAAIESLDRVPAPIAGSLLDAVRGLAAGLPADLDAGLREDALRAHARLVGHIERAAENGDPDAALGSAGLAALMGGWEATTVDLGELARRADAERERLTDRFTEACARVEPDADPFDVAHRLVRDHPAADGVLPAAREWTEKAIAFTKDRDLVPYHDGECRVELAPESRRWAMAMMSWAGAGEADGPSFYHITPPDPSWSQPESEEWLEVFSATTLPAITVHEVAPGHFSHGRALRRAPSDVRGLLGSMAFIEGWAHYAEELCVEEGFCADDPRFAIGVWLEALVRVTRLRCALGVHTGAMTVEEGARRFESDTHLTGPAARAEAQRAAYDPTYGRYTWGKLEIMRLREQARKRWGTGYSVQRFNRALLRLGAPPLGLIDHALEQG